MKMRLPERLRPPARSDLIVIAAIALIVGVVLAALGTLVQFVTTKEKE